MYRIIMGSIIIPIAVGIVICFIDYTFFGANNDEIIEKKLEEISIKIEDLSSTRDLLIKEREKTTVDNDNISLSIKTLDSKIHRLSNKKYELFKELSKSNNSEKIPEGLQKFIQNLPDKKLNQEDWQ